MNLGTLTMKEGTKILDEVVVNSNGKVMADGYTIFPSSSHKHNLQLDMIFCVN